MGECQSDHHKGLRSRNRRGPRDRYRRNGGVVVRWWPGHAASPRADGQGSVCPRLFRKESARVTHGIERPLRQLDVLTGILALIEQEEVISPQLERCRAILTTGRLRILRGDPAAGSLLGAPRLGAQRDLRADRGARVLVASRGGGIESWRREFGGRVPEWLAIAGEYEALSSLARLRVRTPLRSISDRSRTMLKTPRPGRLRRDSAGSSVGAGKQDGEKRRRPLARRHGC